MCLLSVDGMPDPRHLAIYAWTVDEEKRAEVSLTGLLQATQSGYLIVGVPTSLVRGIFDSLHEPGISLPSAIDGGALRAGIVVMTPDELQSIGGATVVTERGKPYAYRLGELSEENAVGWPGVSKCWHLRVRSDELAKLRQSYGLPAKVEGTSDFSIVVACRRSGVLASNSVSKAVSQDGGMRLPDWTSP